MPITAVRAEPISGDIQPDLAIISSLGEHLRGQYVLVRVHDSDGRVGLGEASVTSVWSGETRADDRVTEAAMEDRKKEGYF